MATKLFEYAVIYRPKVVKDALGNETQGPDELVVTPTYVLSKSDNEVAMKAARAIPDKFVELLDQVEIVVRPFS